MVKLRSSLYDTMGQFGGFGLMDLLASFALFDDDPARVNSLVAQFDKVTPELSAKNRAGIFAADKPHHRFTATRA